MKSPKSNRPNSNPVQNNDSFLEAFRDLGNDFFNTAKNDLLKAGANDIKDALFPLNNPSQKGESSDYLAQKEAELERNYRAKLRQTETIHRQEKVLFTREQRETQQQVTVLQEEIKKLAKATSDLASEAKEAEITALQTLPEVGTYHLNFFSRLRKIIAELRIQIQESSLWLAAWNKKAQKRNFYWGQFKKSGSKFLLSSDRYMATQAG
jgi:ATPase subunit of ABC transporter with duplicated ATPase domains